MSGRDRTAGGSGREIVVQKYGGSSLASADHIRRVASRICARRASGVDLVVVVSAMGGATDELISQARAVVGDGGPPEARELDTLLSTGELVSAALMAMAIRSLGQDVVSLSGTQAGIRTDEQHGSARIAAIDSTRLRRELDDGRIVVVAGFQGLSDTQDVTTLGRGASDTTAVALAAQLDARCEIYTDVEGIYTSDPRLVPEARKLPEIGYEEMLELASLGAKMNPRSIELGAVYGVPILVASAFGDAAGTLIRGERQPGSRAMEMRNAVTAVATDHGLARIALRNAADRPGVAAGLFEAVAEAGVPIDMIVANDTPGSGADLTFTVGENDAARAAAAAGKHTETRVETARALARVSIVGTGMLNSPGYAARMFRALATASVNIHLVATAEIRIACVVDGALAAVAEEALTKEFGAPIVDLASSTQAVARAHGFEGPEIAGVAVDRNVARITVRGVEDRPGVAADLFEPLAGAGVSVDVVVQTASRENLTDVTLTVAEGDCERAEHVTRINRALAYQDLIADRGLAKVSIVGAGLRRGQNYAARMFRVLADAGVNIRSITTSDIRVTCIVAAEEAQRAARSLHSAFRLAEEPPSQAAPGNGPGER